MATCLATSALIAFFRLLLTPNAQTGKKLLDDPAVMGVEIINEDSGHQYTETTAAEALRFAEDKVAERIIRWICDGSMLNFFKRKSFSGILDATQDHMSGADIRDLDVLSGIESSSILHGVEQDFPKCRPELVSLRFW